MKMSKKISVLVSLTLVATTFFTGCGAQTGTKGDTAKTGASLSDSAKGKSANEVSKSDLPIVKEKASLKVLVCVSDDGGAPISPKDTVIHKEIAEQTNVDIDWVEIAKSAWKEKKGLVLASGELPDAFLDRAGLFTDSEMLNMAAQKTIIPLDTLSDYSPNFTALMEGDPALRPTITAQDGHIYGLPYYIQPSGPDATLTCNTANVFYINKKWLDAVKMDVPKTTEEFKKVLQAFKTQDPNGNKKADEIPMTSTATAMYNDWFGSFGRVTSNAVNADSLNIGLKDGKAVFEPAQAEFKEGIKYFADLNKAGLLDIESFTQDAKVFNAKLKAPVRTVGAFKAWRGTAWRSSPEDKEYIAIPALTGPKGDHVWPRRFDGVISRASYIITSSCKNPELAIRWGDNLMAADNTYQFWSNLKIGYNVEAVPNQPFKLLKPSDMNDAEYKKQTGGVGGNFGICAVDTKNRERAPIDPNPVNVGMEKHITDKLYADSYPKEFYPNVFLNIDESKITNEISTELDNYIVKTCGEWITKGGVDKGWDAYLKQLDTMGLPKLMEQYQTALDRFNKNK